MNKITASFEKFVSSIYPFKKSAIVDQVKKMNESPAMMPKAIMNPYILEERQLNVAQLDVFSRYYELHQVRCKYNQRSQFSFNGFYFAWIWSKGKEIFSSKC